MEINDDLLRVQKLTVTKAAKQVLEDISFVLKRHDHLAVTGASGSGKTLLGLALAGRTFYKGEIHFNPAVQTGIAWIEQQHHFKTLSNTSDFYYQQRFNSYDSEDAQTVKEALEENGSNSDEVLKLLKIESLAGKPLIQLSNGENKKLQIARALLALPSVLIMDQPFAGLDAATRTDLHHLINQLANQGISVILITTAAEIPACITRVLELDKGKIKTMQSREAFSEKELLSPRGQKAAGFSRETVKRLSSASSPAEFDVAIRMRNVNVQYGEKKILQQIDWEVKKGERWLLSGPNGAGKSTLLSLVTADNPQAYANDIFLFDRKRGSGESIWDIKKKIGYLSPELHLFFDQGATCFETVASGLFDTIGLFRQLSDEDSRIVQEWIALAGIEDLQQKRLYELSVGQQRVILLLRAMVKNPPLLILDEPCQGLDIEKQAGLLELIDAVCLYGNKTMVFVTHYANERPECIERFIQLEQGRVVKM